MRNALKKIIIRWRAPAVCVVAELCDPVDEDITGAGDIDALFVGASVLKS